MRKSVYLSLVGLVVLGFILVGPSLKLVPSTHLEPAPGLSIGQMVSVGKDRIQVGFSEAWADWRSTALRGNPTEWRVKAFKIDLVRDQIGISGDVLRREDTGWIHIGSNHLEGGAIRYAVPVGKLDKSDILEVWIDGYSESSNPDVGPTILIGGRNIGQVTRRVGDAWKPKVFQFADDLIYGDLTEPSNRNESWRIRYPSNKYQSDRINRDPGSLVGPDGRLPIEIAMTGRDAFVIKRVEVDVYKNITGGEFDYNPEIHIVDIYPNPAYTGDFITLHFNKNIPALGVDVYVMDPDGIEQLKARHPNLTANSMSFLASGAPFFKSGLYRARVVFHSGSKTLSDMDSFYFYTRSTSPYPESPQAYAPPPAQSLEPSQAYSEPPRPTYENLPPFAGPPPSSYERPPEAFAEPPVPSYGRSPQPFVPPPTQPYAKPPPPPLGEPPEVYTAPPLRPDYEVPPPGLRLTPIPRGNYTIQVAANRTHYNAVKLQDRLKRRGYPAYISEIYVPGLGHFFRVRVGTYPDRFSAEREAYHLRVQEGLETWITRDDSYGRETHLPVPPDSKPFELTKRMDYEKGESFPERGFSDPRFSTRSKPFPLARVDLKSARASTQPATNPPSSSATSVPEKSSKTDIKMDVKSTPTSEAIPKTPSKTEVTSAVAKSGENEIEETVWNALIKRSIPGYSYQVKNINVTGEQADVLVVEESKKGEVKKIHYALEKKAGKWFVRSVAND